MQCRGIRLNGTSNVHEDEHQNSQTEENLHHKNLEFGNKRNIRLLDLIGVLGDNDSPSPVFVNAILSSPLSYFSSFSRSFSPVFPQGCVNNQAPYIVLDNREPYMCSKVNTLIAYI